MLRLLRFGLSLSFCADLACASTQRYCDCADPGAVVEIPLALVSDVARITSTGPACTSAPPQCVLGDTASCTRYFVNGTAPGNCHIEVAFKSGAPTFTADVVFEARGEPDCCAGFYPKDYGYVQVPERGPDGGTDG